MHVNLTRGADGATASGAEHVLKLNYTSLQHAVAPVDAIASSGSDAALAGAPGRRARAARAAAPRRVGLRPRRARAVPWLRADGGRRAAGEPFANGGGAALAGPARRACCRRPARSVALTGDAISTAGALAYGFGELGWAAALCGPGPGIVGSGSRFGHGGMVALDSAHTALALGAATVIVPRMSRGDPRARSPWAVPSHADRARAAARAAIVALPAGEAVRELRGHAHDWRQRAADVEGYGASGLPAESMGRTLMDDPLFFAAALSAGALLGELARERIVSWQSRCARRGLRARWRNPRP